ncbi:MAG: DUF502 domain-containing protein [Bdellovibrionaceae bacterium]|nr:DUF502 domain-containing protein [Pseudobdellovibrionaceae bacterium]
MKLWFNFFLKGLLVVAPISISVYCIVLIVVFVEKLIQQGISKLFVIDFQFPGLGILFAIILITVIGMVMHTLVAQKLYGLLQQVIAKLPVLKTIYFAIEDFMGFFADQSSESTNKKVVLVDLAEDLVVIGIITNENPEHVVHEAVSGKIAVYLPMSYQIGGYTIFVDKSKLRETDLSVEDGMKLSMTAWMKKTP